MNNQNLLIYESDEFFNILNELSENLNFKVIKISKKEFSNINLNDYEDYLILTSQKNFNKSKQVLYLDFPIKFSNLIEKINLQFLKQKFSKQSSIEIGNYKIDINSRELKYDNLKLKLTEKEVNTIIYLSKKNKPVNINELQENVWSYQTGIETHTVETHIYRLRKKMKETFGNESFILNTSNGYSIDK